MTVATTFAFPEETLQFLLDLEAHNNRDWFQENKKRYEQDLLEPAKEFVLAIGPALQAAYPNVRFDPRTNGSGSMMRIYRDTRFSKDKTPYKTFLGFSFWEGAGKKTTCPAFHFGISAEDGGRGGVHVGMHGFDKEMLAAYREAVADETLGAELETAVSQIKASGDYKIEGQHYKRVPRGFDADHPRADWLRHNALYGSTNWISRADLTRPSFLEDCLTQFHNLAPLHRWLVKVHQM